MHGDKCILPTYIHKHEYVIRTMTPTYTYVHSSSGYVELVEDRTRPGFELQSWEG